ncbi:MAG: DUF5329 family protein [Woeseiaceae bacterium]
MKVLTTTLLLCLLPLAAPAGNDVPTEIDYLLRSVGGSDCVFIRNNKRHNSREAEEHLRMKYKLGKRYAQTGEKFIERLASKSSFSKKLYYVECSGEKKIPSGDWLMKRLSEYRSRPDNIRD